jgi:DNA-directed RNA polymerase subunit RPC12/RpoP
MADKVPIICPECAKQFQAPLDIVGRKIRCKNCGKAFVAKQAEDVGLGQKKEDAATFSIKDDDDDDDGDGTPYEVTSVDLAPRCPACANELESETAKVCLHCGFNLETRTAAEKRRVKDVTGGDMFVWLLPGILCAVGFFICLGFFVSMIFLRIGWQWESQPDQWQVTCLNCCTLWWCLFMIWFMYLQGKFAVKRLIYENQPPEVEL